MTREYQTRDKFFWNYGMFKNWGYADKRGIGVNLADFHGKSDPIWTFVVDGNTYSIDAKTGTELEKKYTLVGKWPMPNIIPLEAFKRQFEEQTVTSMQLGFQI